MKRAYWRGRRFVSRSNRAPLDKGDKCKKLRKALILRPVSSGSMQHRRRDWWWCAPSVCSFGCQSTSKRRRKDLAVPFMHRVARDQGRSTKSRVSRKNRSESFESVTMRDSIILPTKAATMAWARDFLSFAGKPFKCFSTRETNLKTPSEAFWRVLPPARHSSVPSAGRGHALSKSSR